MSESIPAWAMERARAWFGNEHLARDFATAHREGFDAGKEAAAQILERRARGFASGGHCDAIFNGRLVAEELNTNAQKCRAHPYSEPTEPEGK